MQIEVKKASKVIKGTRVLEDISFDMTSGTIYGIEGPNGSGKTMLMRAILGLIRLTAGSVLVDGKELGRDMDFAPNAGALIESPAFLPNKTGRENLIYLVGIKGVVGEREVDRALDKVGLRQAEKKKFRQFSLGMRQRLGIASAIVEQPDLVVLDEPTNALDASGIQMVKTIVEEQKRSGALVVISSHDRRLLSEVADVRIELAEGGIANVEERHR